MTTGGWPFSIVASTTTLGVVSFRSKCIAFSQEDEKRRKLKRKKYQKPFMPCKVRSWNQTMESTLTDGLATRVHKENSSNHNDQSCFLINPPICYSYFPTLTSET